MNAPDAITIIAATDPARVCKTYSRGADGKLAKRAVAHVTEGTACTMPADSADALLDLLQQVTESDNRVICPGIFRDAGDAPFRLVAEKRLAQLTGTQIGEAPGGVQVVNGERVAARLKRGIAPSAWLLLDADNPPGIPEAWRVLTLAERLAQMEVIIPGISICERVELRGSSSRVTNGTGIPGPHTHAWVRVSDPTKIEVLRHAALVAAVNAGIAFPSPRHSRIDPEKVVGYAWRSLLDFAVWDTGRLVFAAKPDVQAPGYTGVDAGIRIVNRGGGTLDLSAVTLPDDSALGAFAGRTGARLDVRRDGDRITVRNAGELTWETEIERRGMTKTLRQWVAGMKPGERMRCETPFRASVSEAAVLRLGISGRPVLHDVGSGVTYHLAEKDDRQDASPLALSQALLADERDIPPRRYVGGEGAFPRPKLTALSGAPGVSKTTLAIEIAMAIAAGVAIEGLVAPDQPERVLFGLIEDDVEEAQRRAHAAAAHFTDPQHLRDLVNRNLRFVDLSDAVPLFVVSGDANMTETDGFRRLEATIRAFKPALLVLDPLVEIHTAEEKSNTALRPVLRRLRLLAAAQDLALVLIHHETKSAEGTALQRLRGGGGIGGAIRSLLSLRPMTTDEAREFDIDEANADLFVRVETGKAQYARRAKPRWLVTEERTLANEDVAHLLVPWSPPVATITPEIVAKALAALRKGYATEPCSESPNAGAFYGKALELAGVARPVRSAALDALKRSGEVEVRAWHSVKARKSFGRLWVSGNTFEGWGDNRAQ